MLEGAKRKEEERDSRRKGRGARISEEGKKEMERGGSRIAWGKEEEQERKMEAGWRREEEGHERERGVGGGRGDDGHVKERKQTKEMVRGTVEGKEAKRRGRPHGDPHTPCREREREFQKAPPSEISTSPSVHPFVLCLPQIQGRNKDAKKT